MDGYELLSTLRSNPNYKDLPVVMVTSRAHEKHRRKAMDLGASAYLVKPYQEENLIRILRDLVQNAPKAVTSDP
jgi:chemosensory pili system protein ChpA (sensor histidine kinase/response regulator)